MYVTSRDEILGRSALHREEVYIEAWGKSIWLRELTLAERLELEANTTAASEGTEEQDKQAGMELFLRMILLSAETPDQQSIFGPEDMDALRHSSGAGIYEAGIAALRVNHMRQEDAEALKKS